jgi:hypothetical protein
VLAHHAQPNRAAAWTSACLAIRLFAGWPSIIRLISQPGRHDHLPATACLDSPRSHSNVTSADLRDQRVACLGAAIASPGQQGCR